MFTLVQMVDARTRSGLDNRFKTNTGWRPFDTGFVIAGKF